MPRGIADCVEHLFDERNGDALVEQVAHRVHKHPSRLFPLRGKGQQLGVHRQLEAVPVARLSHGTQSGCHSFRITVQATLTDLCAAGHWVPGAFRPFDTGESQGLLLQYLLGNLDRHASAALIRCSETQEKHRAIAGVSQEKRILCNTGEQGAEASEKELFDPVETSVFVLSVFFAEQT